MNTVDLGAGAFTVVVVVAVAFGVACSLLVIRFANPERIRLAWRRLAACLLEFRLFLDDPMLMLQTERDVIRAYVGLLRAVLQPLLVLLIISAPVIALLYTSFSDAPLPLRQPAVITLRTGQPFAATLFAPPQIRIDTPALRIPGINEVSWRIVPTADTNGTVIIKTADSTAAMKIAAGSGFHVAFDFGHSSIQISYPRATILGRSWMTWFLVFSCLAACLTLPLSRLVARASQARERTFTLV